MQEVIDLDEPTRQRIAKCINSNLLNTRDSFFCLEYACLKIIKLQTKEKIQSIVIHLFKLLDDLDVDYSKVLKSYKKQIEQFVMQMGRSLFTNCFHERIIGPVWDRLFAFYSSPISYEECLMYQILQYHRKNVMYIREEDDMESYLSNVCNLK